MTQKTKIAKAVFLISRSNLFEEKLKQTLLFFIERMSDKDVENLSSLVVSSEKSLEAIESDYQIRRQGVFKKFFSKIKNSKNNIFKSANSFLEKKSLKDDFMQEENLFKQIENLK